MKDIAMTMLLLAAIKFSIVSFELYKNGNEWSLLFTTLAAFSVVTFCKMIDGGKGKA
jgi:hypothetical protein